MNKFLISLFLVCSLSFAGWLGQNDYTHAKALITSAQNITSVWTDVGDPIKANGFKRIAIPLTIAINNSSNVRFRPVYQITSGSADILYTIATVGASSVAIEPQYYEFNVDEDATNIIDFDILPTGYFQLQTQVSAEGATKAAISHATYILLGE